MFARHLIAAAAIATGLGVGVGTAAEAAPAPGHARGAAVVRPAYSWWYSGTYDSQAKCDAAGATAVFLTRADDWECTPNNGWTKFALYLYDYEG
jgi:hypothetical protein